MIYLLAVLIGVIAGLRAMTAPAAVAWAAWLGWFSLAETPLAFLGTPWAVGVLSLLAIGELINDQRPGTPSRKVPIQFAGRVLMGGLAGAAIGAAHGMLPHGAIAGVLGAVLGTYGGAAVRASLAKGFGRDPPAALIEDIVAIAGAAAIVSML